MATGPVGYGTPSDPHGWAWLKTLRDRTPAVPPAGTGGGAAVTDNGDGTFTITA